MNERELKDALHRLAPVVDDAGVWEALHREDRGKSGGRSKSRQLPLLVEDGQAATPMTGRTRVKRPIRPARVMGTIAVAACVLVALGFGISALADRLGGDGGVVVITDETMNPGSTPGSSGTPSSATASPTSEGTSTTAETPTTGSSPSSTAPSSTGAPGDSAGAWVETVVDEAPTQVHAVSVSDQALLMATRPETGARLWAYLFDSEELIELPVSGTDVYHVDIDGLLAVWLEGTSDEESGVTTEQHIYAYLLPNGPKIEVAEGRQGVSYPQVAGSRITWTEGTPSADLPDEYWQMPIFGVKIDAQGAPQGEPVELMPSVVATVAGDSFFTYSLSGTHLAWEQGRAADGLALGTHVMELGGLQSLSLGAKAWRPSLGGKTVVYRENGLKARNLDTGQVREIDPQGDYASAASTFVAYYRMPETEFGHELVAQGLTGGYEQVLGTPTEIPYLSPAIAVSDHHVAFVTEGAVELFRWQGR